MRRIWVSGSIVVMYSGFYIYSLVSWLSGGMSVYLGCRYLDLEGFRSPGMIWECYNLI